MLTASRAALAMECTWWMRPDAPRIESSPGVAADEGTAIHAMAEAHVRKQDAYGVLDTCDLTPESKERVRQKFRVWLDWFANQLHDGWRPEVALAYDPHTDRARELQTDFHRDYSRAEPGEICMTADVLAEGEDDEGRYAWVLDWKTGQDSAYAPAQLGVLGLAWARLLGVDRAHVSAVYVGEESVHQKPVWMGAWDMDAMRAELLRVLDHPDPEPRPGPHCAGMWCPARHQCPATTAIVSEAIRMPLGDIEEFLRRAITTPAQAGLAHVRLKIITDAMESLVAPIKAQIRSVVAEQGSAPTKPGFELRLNEESRETFRKELVPRDVLDGLRADGYLETRKSFVLREGKVRR